MSIRRAATAALLAPIAAAAASLAAVVVTGAHRRLGATADEARAALPGDDLLPGAQVQNDRACTIAAPPSSVWPWIAQLGQNKAGFYSFEGLENLVGCQITGATRIHPEWQDVAVGDRFTLHPDIALRVAEVEPGRALVVSSQGADAPGDMDFDTTWAFCLSPVTTNGSSATRLHLRERYATSSPATRAMIEVTSVISAVMTWRVMTNLRELVDRNVEAL
ncbi:hypothetical protein GOPIP_067_00620 [Gordonia polyisoprenivorans NBRC 16320 = JCM 10675]|uniref:SRPBCC family protein n=1 Tax=Gordonia polyisoprenivorans TaxID=84595 RepID=A0A846WG00_9ACTN|nr:hypothetical protein [Gordonia polyisoprenivorans]NKY00398.1 hypothetical protein [Gordonia polyisoprenivorans]GAB24419.1 hypothetical protein GOPIP_067_00620 [Gordonia polyisoprenivorans NBRC 16320 = JCM 10675]